MPRDSQIACICKQKAQSAQVSAHSVCTLSNISSDIKALLGNWSPLLCKASSFPHDVCFPLHDGTLFHCGVGLSCSQSSAQGS